MDKAEMAWQSCHKTSGGFQDLRDHAALPAAPFLFWRKDGRSIHVLLNFTPRRSEVLFSFGGGGVRYNAVLFDGD